MDRSRSKGDDIDSELISCLSMASELQPLHPLHRVAGITIRKCVLVEGIGDFSDGISNAMAGFKTSSQQLAGILPIRAGIVRSAHHDFSANFAFYLFGNVEN